MKNTQRKSEREAAPEYLEAEQLAARRIQQYREAIQSRQRDEVTENARTELRHALAPSSTASMSVAGDVPDRGTAWASSEKRAAPQEMPRREKRPNRSTDRYRGYMTRAAYELLQASGLLGAEISSLEKRLGRGNVPVETNYTASAGRLCVEAIDDEGTARLFEIRPQEFTGEKDVNWREEPSRRTDSWSDIMPTDTYDTIEIGAIYKRSPKYWSVGRLRIKSPGRLCELFQEAESQGIVVRLARNDIESPLVVQKGDKVVAVSSESINRRDRWEQGLSQAIVAALESGEMDGRQRGAVNSG